MLKPHYRSGKDDLANDFFRPCLRLATRYRRAVGYFSTSALLSWTDALLRLASEGVLQVQLIASPELSPADAATLRSLQDPVRLAAYQAVIVDRVFEEIVALLDAPAVPPYDLSRLRRQSQGHPAFVGQILRSFQASMPLSLAQLHVAAAARHWAQAAEIAHHIKPNLLALGVVGVAAPLEMLSLAHPKATAGTVPAPEVLLEAVEQLAAVVGQVLAAMPVELAALEATA